ncbi:MAG: amidohydrolase family protein [Oscillospiraceae bacterium]|jgi:imidazolonepropionase-like amidohydrolase|nr:amidohydrolase family protein [Oscillospiraceae bacterium]
MTPRTVPPGPRPLTEAHAHIIADGASYAAAQLRHKLAPDAAFIRSQLTAIQASSVTFYRDGGDKLGVSARAKTLAPEYGIDYRTPVAILHRAGYYGGLYGFAFRDLAEYRALVRRVKAEGADFIKLAVSGILDFAGDGGLLGASLTLQELIALVNVAHGEGFRVMAHCNGAENVKNALAAGVSSIEHGFGTDAEAIGLLCETGAVWVPTAVTVANNLGGGRFPDATLRGILSRHTDALRLANTRGALIACGSDGGAFGVPQGQGTRDEDALLRSFGIDPARGNDKIREMFRRL